MRLLLISNSTQHGRGYLDHCADAVTSFFQGSGDLWFVPWALHDLDAYAATASSRFEAMGLRLDSLHRAADPLEAIRSAGGFFVGGGNTFRLLDSLYRLGLIDAIRDRVRSGAARYMGSSAGSVISAPTLKTTNDMPIVQPPSFDSLGLIPFQINAHYLDADPSSTHMGETREKRILEFHEVNETPVLGLREGGWIEVDGTSARLRGLRPARLFRRGEEPEELAAGSALDFLLEPS